MIFDAVSVARRGVGAEELRLASPAFLDAVRWAAYAERVSEPLGELSAAAHEERPRGLPDKDYAAFAARRQAARDELKKRRVLLLLDGDDG